jgi:hypothetical protein
MAGASVSKRVQREYKRTEVVDLYLKGYSQLQIVNEMERRETPVSRSTVCKYLAETREEWREKRMEDMDAILERELAKLDKMEQDAAELFDKFNPNATELDETFDCSKEANEWVKTQLKIMEQRHKLLGLYKPVKLDVDSKNVNINAADPESIEAVRSSILSRLSPKY